MLSFTEYTKIFISLFAILDPVGIIPIIIALTMGMTAQKRALTGRIASLTVCGILLVALVVGEALLEFFGISIYSFRTAGGILLLLMSINMLLGNSAKQVPVADSGDGDATSSIAVVPLSTPLLAGPGALSTVILDAHLGHSVWHYLIMGIEIVLLSLLVWITFLAAPWVARRMGPVSINVFSRLMGLILASIAVEFIAAGLRGLFPSLS